MDGSQLRHTEARARGGRRKEGAKWARVREMGVSRETQGRAGKQAEASC